MIWCCVRCSFLVVEFWVVLPWLLELVVAVVVEDGLHLELVVVIVGQLGVELLTSHVNIESEVTVPFGIDFLLSLCSVMVGLLGKCLLPHVGLWLVLVTHEVIDKFDSWDHSVSGDGSDQ